VAAVAIHNGGRHRECASRIPAASANASVNIGARGCDIATEEDGPEGMADHLQALLKECSRNPPFTSDFYFPKRARLHLAFHPQHGFNMEGLREEIDEVG
jgi:hypothetical protein